MKSSYSHRLKRDAETPEQKRRRELEIVKQRISALLNQIVRSPGYDVDLFDKVDDALDELEALSENRT